VPHHPLPVGGAAAACRWHLQPLYYFSCHRPISLTWVEYNPTKTSRQLMLHHAVFLLKTSATLKARKKTSLHILKIVRVTWCEGIIYKTGVKHLVQGQASPCLPVGTLEKPPPASSASSTYPFTATIYTNLCPTDGQAGIWLFVRHRLVASLRASSSAPYPAKGTHQSF
jgi:hypothetical protein